MRSRFVSFAAISLLLAACVAAPDDVAQLSADHALDQRSEHGLVEATVALDSPAITRGPNDLSVTLRSTEAKLAPTLTSVQASMAAHGHRASTADIVSDGETFRVTNLDLFMSGRWQVTLGVELEDSSDVIEFALDVP